MKEIIHERWCKPNRAVSDGRLEADVLDETVLGGEGRQEAQEFG
eukprot:CAMPEP_0175891528 /NCGR_PEP_ID=MMETSP0107_2-20121207/48432_1 /TAXON_ID=195067 ORGANISM="Goniomonas pacifica, Strain CCMP1869" /NCGR_SAMPLE_ID=MMETSP0107_2 /ASSEMBLY_ACC=CAM_ASM_000203 /LENGTH=43 /DNA_ID= /DNA_START= /DNA_END= /DNA_ORIENTATION=